MKKLHHTLLAALALLTMACGSDNNGNEPEPDTKPYVEAGLKVVTYKESNEEIANPERGLYTQTEPGVTDKYVALSELRRFRNHGKTLVQLMYYLEGYQNSDLPNDFITKLEVDLDMVREARMKAILRFAYTKHRSGADAPMNIIRRHLDQIKPVLHKHVGVIACVQAGFIGAWGEWYYSTNKLNNATAYRQLLNKWLEVLPAERCIQVRVPKYKQDFVGNATPLTSETAFKNTPAARIGHHNDAFMADESNMGTYLDVAKDRNYVAQDALYVPLGGETAEPASKANWATGQQAWNDVSTLHWSFLNDAYFKPLLQSWENGGYFGRIKKMLGYRIYLTKAAYSENNAPGSDLTLNLWLANSGTACMYNARPAIVVLHSVSENDYYLATTNIDLRTIQPGKTSEQKLKLKLPQSLPVGKYKLYMWLPDGNDKLVNMSEYAVQLANTTAWERQTGYNDLGITLNVAQDKNAKAGTSSIVFTKKKR